MRRRPVSVGTSFTDGIRATSLRTGNTLDQVRHYLEREIPELA